MNITCPDCKSPVPMRDETRVGDVEICDNCGAELEVSAVGPIQVQAIEEEK